MTILELRKKKIETIQIMQFTKENLSAIKEWIKQVDADQQFVTMGDLFTEDVLVINVGDWYNRQVLYFGDWLVLKDGKFSKMTNQELLDKWFVASL